MKKILLVLVGLVMLVGCDLDNELSSYYDAFDDNDLAVSMLGDWSYTDSDSVEHTIVFSEDSRIWVNVDGIDYKFKVNNNIVSVCVAISQTYTEWCYVESVDVDTMTIYSFIDSDILFLPTTGDGLITLYK